MAYENTLSIPDISSKIPEHFTVLHAVKYVSLKRAVHRVYPTEGPDLTAR